MTRSAPDSFCPHFQRAIELVGRRWSGTILRALLARPLRFSEISARIPEISDRSLSLRLKELEAEGVLVRRVEATQPVTVRYELLDKGRALESVMEESSAGRTSGWRRLKAGWGRNDLDGV